MPSTRSSAATKCISEVPGLAKQTSTPPATNVRTRLSAPFIASPLSTLLGFPPDQPLFSRFVKGLAGHCWYRAGHVVFFNRAKRKCRSHRLVACLSVPGMACLDNDFSRAKIMIKALGWLCAAVTMLAAGQAQAQFFDMRDIMGGGPNFRGGGYSGGGSSPIPRGAVMLGG